MLSFEEHVKKYDLDEEEQEILAAFEAGKLKRSENAEENIAALREAARETVRALSAKSAKFRATARKPYTLRLHSGAVDTIKEFAKRYGGHYQSLVDDAVVELAERLKAEMP